jgi:hypothetical protein
LWERRFGMWGVRTKPLVRRTQVGAVVEAAQKRSLRGYRFDDRVFPKTPRKPPVVLSPEEVARLRYAAALFSGTFMNMVSTALMA